MKLLSIVVLSILACAAGCGGSGGQVGVVGTVSFNGKPVERGTVTLHPIQDTVGPMVGGVIENGAYEIPAEKGPVVGGVYRVRIVGSKKTGQMQSDRDRPNATTEVYVSVIPAEFNSKSKLEAVITNDRPNRLDYAL